MSHAVDPPCSRAQEGSSGATCRQDRQRSKKSGRGCFESHSMKNSWPSFKDMQEMARTVQGRETVYYNSQCVASYRAVLTVDHSTSRIEKLPRATPGFQQPHLKASRHCVKKNIKQKESGHYHSYHACECTQCHRYKMYTTMQAHWASLHPLGCGKKKTQSKQCVFLSRNNNDHRLACTSFLENLGLATFLPI